MWITGFTEAEGCFSIIVIMKSILKIKIRLSFEINLHSKDVDILLQTNKIKLKKFIFLKLVLFI